MVNAIVLAGDSKSPIEDVSNKALIKIKGRYMIEYVIDSLKYAKCIDKIVVIGPKSLKGPIGHKVYGLLESDGTIVKNVKRGMELLGDDKSVLLCTCDIPMVSSEAIEDFVKQCVDIKADIGYPIIEKSLNDIKYPEVKRTYVKMQDGTYTGGNIIYANPKAMKKCYHIAEALVENRKNVFKMSRVLGFTILLKLALGILNIKNVEKRVNKLLGVNARAIITSYPEIGNDVDKIDDLDFVNKYMDVGA